MKLAKLVAGLLVGYVQLSSNAQAGYSAYIDEFTITRNGSLFFQDTFTDGIEPPIAPNTTSGAPIGYTTAGTFASNSEQNGRLILDTARGVIGVSSAGTRGAVNGATLMTNTINTNLTAGLKTSHTFSITALFDLIDAPIDGGYGIRLYDGTGDDVLDLRVSRFANQGLVVHFRDNDFVARTITELASETIGLNHEQIALTLTRQSLSSNAINASFQFFDGGNAVAPAFEFAETGSIFNGENFTLAQFRAVEMLPEPSIGALLGIGFLAIGVARRNRAITSRFHAVPGSASVSK